MRHIMVLNPKGGCGKSTIATNLADWLERRPEDRAPIAGVAGYEDGLRHVPRSSDVVVIDAPARSHGKELTQLLQHAETILVPVLPSMIDMQAAARFIDEIKATPTLKKRKARIAVVANRVRENTLIFDELDAFLRDLKVPYVATLREAQNYIRAYTRGLGVLELPDYLSWPDQQEWGPLTDWLGSRAARP